MPEGARRTPDTLRWGCKRRMTTLLDLAGLSTRAAEAIAGLCESIDIKGGAKRSIEMRGLFSTRVPNVTCRGEGACYSVKLGARVENGRTQTRVSERLTCRKVVGERVNPRDADPDLRPPMKRVGVSVLNRSARRL
jgi:hypothetical protein